MADKTKNQLEETIKQQETMIKNLTNIVESYDQKFKIIEVMEKTIVRLSIDETIRRSND